MRADACSVQPQEELPEGGPVRATRSNRVKQEPSEEHVGVRDLASCLPASSIPLVLSYQSALLPVSLHAWHLRLWFTCTGSVRP